MDRVLADAIAVWGRPTNVVWTAGNNDGPHNSIFRKQVTSGYRE